MEKFVLQSGAVSTKFLVDNKSDAGIKKVTKKVCEDYCNITGLSTDTEEISEKLPSLDTAVLALNCENSEMLKDLSKKYDLDLSDVYGKWEVYKMFSLSTESIKNLLLIVGSDRLGTIYGLFTLSELMGVSPLTYIADSVIPKKKELIIDIDTNASKEPSVKFRGFFINDEWPCFGNWTMEHFGGFTAEMYDHVFELLLRLKGNYMWPAMWSSSFSWDGPGLKSYELASEYGIYMGNSHHEPCLRAGEEYRQVRGKDSIYGDAWNFHKNTEGITRFWKDSLDERGMFTSMVTVGMRGEADSTILGANATLKDNIDLLKDVITCQKKLIKETEEKYNKTFPKVLALYKEVEPFYYGDENAEGLCDWSELEDVILMLCEDNHGYLRTVPDEKMRKHPAGFGMYYHVDYHGDPISYEWINSSPITTMWEQMSQAYDYGVRSVWILNVGDLKHNEFPLSYFMNLAYDFDKWGSNAPNKTMVYTKETLKTFFGGELSCEMVEKASKILTETVRINGYRRPEALNPSIYSPCHFDEAEKLLKRLSELEAELEGFEAKLTLEQRNAWFSLTGFQTRAVINLLRMHLYGGMNELFARQGLKLSNKYADLTAECIKKDKELKTLFADFLNHKWRGMELASHVGFTKWNEDGSRYPLKIYVEPFDRPRLYVTRTDDEKVYDKVYGPCMKISIKDFEFEGHDKVAIRLSNMGIGSLKVKIDVPDNNWLSCDIKETEVLEEKIATFTCDRSKLRKTLETVTATITDNDTTVKAEFTARTMADSSNLDAFLPGPFGYSILAKHFDSKKVPKGHTFEEIDDYGVYDSAMKVYPTLTKYEKGNEPSLSYKVFCEDEGEYTFEADFAPTSPLFRDGKLSYGVSVNGKLIGEYNTVAKDYKAGVASCKEWSIGVLDHRRRCFSKINLNKGINEVTLILCDAGLVPMKLYMYKENPPASYFGMPESIRIRK